jgi:hypothetical protein
MTPDDTAANAFRAVDARAESDYLQMLGAVRERTKAESVWKVHEGIPSSRAEKPVALVAELELFRKLHSSAGVYDLSTKTFRARRDALSSALAQVSGALESSSRELSRV